MDLRHDVLGRALLSLSCATIVVSTCGCATPAAAPGAPVGETGRPAEDLTRALEAFEVNVVYYPTPPFREVRQPSPAHWPLSPFGSVLSALLARARTPESSIRSGEWIRMQHRLEDPLRRVRVTFLESLSRRSGMGHIRRAPERFLSTDDLTDLQATFVSGVVIDFWTSGWGVVGVTRTTPFAAERYQPTYLVRVRLVQLGQPRVLWQDTCRSVGRDMGAMWTMEELLANSAEVLRTKLAEAADTCAEELGSKVPT